ncbi:MAG: MgtC/SapB family protein [Paenirhodobacter sp.]|uniref:MgtC/SapB family protein n=1 Tax=Paenirhodobacter sp. TaxID=1965326 RepID=UPI003D0AEEF2
MQILDALWTDLADSFTATPPSVATLRLLAALALGGAIGFEREWHHKPAGLRTHMLISVAAALFALIALELVEISRTEGAASGARSDIVRLIGAVTSGVAFLAAGTIITAGGRVRGLTTGASMWLAGAVGLSCGTGRIGLGALATLITVTVLWVFRRIEERLESPAARAMNEDADMPLTPDGDAHRRHPPSDPMA